MSDICRKPVYRCGGYRIDLLRRSIHAGDMPLAVTAKAFDVLAVLVGRAGEVVTKDELLGTVWADSIVEENNLTQQISALRKLFNERAGDHSFIVTVPGRGYCFVAPLELEAAVAAPLSEIFVAGSETSSITIDLSSSAGGPFRSLSFDPAAMRGTVLAAVYVFVVCFSAFVLGSGRDGSMSGSQPRVVGVLTFRTIGMNDDRYGVGLRDTLRAKLGSLEDVTVRPVGGEFPVSDTLAVGRQMDVDVVLAGSIQQHLDRIRVAVELVDVRGERILWGKTFEGDVSALFELQDSIAAEVAQKIRYPRRSSANRHFHGRNPLRSPLFAMSAHGAV